MTAASLAVVTLIGAYQATISPLLPRTCRFAPTCSEYGRVAVRDHGIRVGGWLAVKRVLRCHPLSRGGYDPPPAADRERRKA